MTNDRKNGRKYSPNLRLQKARLALGLSQEKLAEMLGTTPVSVSRWETGFSSPTASFRPSLSEILGKTMIELGLMPPLPEKIVTLPNKRNPYFTGRDSLLALVHERLSTARMTALTQAQALYGLGGIGKTQVAAEYAFRYDGEYAHIFWIRAATRDLLTTDFVKLAQLLELPEKDAQDSAQVVVAVMHWLTTNAGWLLILDNADDLPLAQEFLPNSHNGYVLFTTRAPASGDIAESIEVENLSLHDGTLLLLRRSKLLDRDAPLESAKTEDRAVAERIVREMDGLPLAIVQAGAYVEETRCSLTDYLNLFATHRKDLLTRRSRFLQDSTETVYTTWSLLFEQVEQHSPAAEVLRLCAFLAPDAIPEELLTSGAAELDIATRTAVIDSFKLNETLEMLLRYSLVRRNRDTHMLSVHRLVQSVFKDGMSQEAQRTWAERTVRVVIAAFPEADYGDGANQQYYLQYYVPHIQECATLIEQYHLHFPEAAQLLFQAGAFLYAHGFYPQSQSFHEQALSIREQVLGPDHPAIAESLNYLAMIARLYNNYKQAEEFHQQALAVRVKTFGSQHPITAESLNNLGVLYRNQGNYEQAAPLLQRAFRIRNQSLGSEHSHTLVTSINLAKLYLEQRNYEQAEQLLKQGLAAFEKVLNLGNPLIAQNLHLLARLSYEQGMNEQAELYWKRAVEIIENRLGPEHPAIAESLNSLAELLFAQGHIMHAQSLCQRALYISENKLGVEHPDTIIYRNHLTKIISKREE